MGATQDLVTWGQRAATAPLPPDVLTFAKHCVLDWLGVTLAGAREPLTRIVFDATCRGDTGDEAELLGFGRRSSALTAALFHGTASHALDYDDTHWGLQGHPTAPVLGALWGLAERERASGAALLRALVAGVEVECVLGRWLNPEHYARGFHATGTLGSFGAAAAAAQLLGLDEAAWLHAFGLAGTQAAGLKSAFGSMAKPLHAGRAAQAGLSSALLAAGGFRGHPAVLEASQGFADTHGSQLTAAERARPDAPFEILGTLFKYHAACYLTHASIEAVRALGAQASEVERIALTVDETCRGVCDIERPRTGMELKFSLKATAAMALLGDATADPRAFSDARATSPELGAWIERVSVAFAPMPATRSQVSLQLRDGRALETACDTGVPERDLARQCARLREKFSALVPLPRRQAEELADCVLALEQLVDLRSLRALCASR